MVRYQQQHQRLSSKSLSLHILFFISKSLRYFPKMRNLWNLCIHMAVNAVYLDEFLPEQCSYSTFHIIYQNYNQCRTFLLISIIFELNNSYQYPHSSTVFIILMDKTTFSYDLQPRNFPQSSEISRFLFAEGQDCSNIQIQY